MENAVRDSIEFTPIMKKAMKPMDSWHVTRREVKRERFRTQFCLARGFNLCFFHVSAHRLRFVFAVSRPLVPVWMPPSAETEHHRPRPTSNAGSPSSTRSLQSGGAAPPPSPSTALSLYDPPTKPPGKIKWTRGKSSLL